MSIKPIREGRVVPASPQQEGVWFHSVQGGTVYWNFVQKKVYNGLPEPAVLRRAFEQVLRRHSALRTRFAVMDERLWQVISEETDLDEMFSCLQFPGGDASETGAMDVEQTIRKESTREEKQEFDFERDIPVRLKALLFEKERVCCLILTVSHILTDALSMGIFWKELSVFYSSFSEGRNAGLSAAPGQYADYCLDLETRRGTAAYRRQQDYWVDKLSGEGMSSSLSFTAGVAIPGLYDDASSSADRSYPDLFPAEEGSLFSGLSDGLFSIVAPLYGKPCGRYRQRGERAGYRKQGA
jgi:hypothetical protein